MTQGIAADYRNQLQSELRRRQAANPRYSMRAFARDLGINAGFLSSLLNGQAELSLTRASRIADALGYSPTQKQEFLQLVLFRKQPEAAAVAANSSEETESRSHEIRTLNLDAFQVVSDWYHYAILELSCCRGFRPDPGWIAARLGISAQDASLAVDRLLRLGLIEKDGSSFKKTDAFIATPSDQPHRALKNFHAQHLEKARRALESLPVEARDLTGVTIPTDPAKLEQAKNEIRKFRRRMAKLLSGSDASEVFHLSIQLYPLTQNDLNEGETK